MLFLCHITLINVIVVLYIFIIFSMRVLKQIIQLHKYKF